MGGGWCRRSVLRSLELNRIDELLISCFELGRTAKTSRTPHMFRVEDTLSPTSPTTHFSAP